ncbi:ABC transporter permease [Fundicoccus culcitae]|uniref:ABC transporter permease subunit n=1 Tax=Fundicoccus culcitae TaxID=2969821 RepID=A0ABY5P4R3_9LACT|nr:ABC transporter permease subunit [Fundicoccus culcitae]UUX33746.1 ABC transporter permease subunit [Fundicoccus culcitae]
MNNTITSRQKRAEMDVEQYYSPIKRSLWSKILKHKTFYMFLLPCIVFFAIFSYWPMSGLILSFKEFRFDRGLLGGDWVGLRYFEQFFRDPRSDMYIRNTLIISALKLFLYLPFPILLALGFNEISNRRAQSTMQSISYLPYFISWVVVVGLIQRILAPNTGLLNQIIQFFGGTGDTFYLMQEEYFFPIVFISYLWKEIGWDSIVYFSAIVGISPSLYEAAAIDGANRLQQTRHITLPSIRTTIFLLFLLSLGGILSAGFDQIYLLQTPGNANVSETIDTYVVQTGLQGGQFGYATAIGMLQGVAGLVLTIIMNRLAKRVSDDVTLW